MLGRRIQFSLSSPKAAEKSTLLPQRLGTGQNLSTSIGTQTADAPSLKSDEKAAALLAEVQHRLAYGPAFSAKVRQRVWAAGRLVMGVGTYLQAGNGTGRFNLQIQMLDGDGEHKLQQISDGRLAWTKTEIAGHQVLKRVDVGRLDEWVRASRKQTGLPPRLEVGAFSEMLGKINRDYAVKARRGSMNGRQLLIISGTLHNQARARITQETKLDEWPELFPSHVKIAIALEDDPDTGFGLGLPVRLEFRGDPLLAESAKADASLQEGPLVSLLELYSIHSIPEPQVERFLFDSQEVVNFINETERYLRNYGIRLTESQRKTAYSLTGRLLSANSLPKQLSLSPSTPRTSSSIPRTPTGTTKGSGSL